MSTNSEDISSQLRERVSLLIKQVERDRAAMQNDPSYTDVFDSLQAILHNLDCSKAEGSKVPRD